MALKKFADKSTNITDSKIERGIQLNTTCMSNEVNGAIRQNSLVDYGIAKAIGVDGDLSYNMPYGDTVADNETAAKIINDGLEKTIVDIAKANYGTISQSNSNIKPLDGYDVSKGTIEDRLSALGFNNGVLEGVDKNSLKPTVKYICLTAIIKFIGYYDNPQAKYWFNKSEEGKEKLIFPKININGVDKQIVSAETTNLYFRDLDLQSIFDLKFTEGSENIDVEISKHPFDGRAIVFTTTNTIGIKIKYK